MNELRKNFDKPEVMKEQFRHLKHVDNVLQRMTIVGVILSFRQLAQDALVDVLESRIPFLVSSVKDFKYHSPSGDPLVVNEMASSAGLQCKVGVFFLLIFVYLLHILIFYVRISHVQLFSPNFIH